MIINHEGEKFSIWTDDKSKHSFLPLMQDSSTDVCIVGGGIVGLVIAYNLLKSGKEIIIVEAEEIGSGQTCKTTAQFTTALDTRYSEIIKSHGLEEAKLVAASHEEAISKLLEIIFTENISCELEKVNGNLFLSNEIKNDNNENQSTIFAHEIPFFNTELEATHQVGLSDVYINEHQTINFNHTYSHKSISLCFPNQYQVNPLMLINGITKAIINLGGKVYTNSRVIKVQGGDNAFVKIENNKKIFCQSIVVATNSPVNENLTIHTKQSAMRSYVIGMEIPSGSMQPFLFWDTSTPYHYVRVERNKFKPYDLLIIGGEDHKTGQSKIEETKEVRFKNLEEWGKRTFKSTGPVRYKWSGQVIETVDGLAHIGRSSLNEANIYISTGLSGNGMTYAMISGSIIRDLILNKYNPWEKIYSPSRMKLSSTLHFLKENLNTLTQYKEWVLDKEAVDLTLLDIGEGVVYQEGLKRVAAYRDMNNSIELHSAVCPHLGGIIHWNKVEKSWDCPCHGSRFDCHGKVMSGPAVTDLQIHFPKHALMKPIIQNENNAIEF